jgi:hypothetical protein
MKIQISEEFVVWFRKTNRHLFVEEPNKKELEVEVKDYINDVLEEHMESLESELLPPQEPDDSPDSGFLEN